MTMSDFEVDDSTLDDLTLSASAYLDGEATPDERASVEANSEALDVVAGFENLRKVLGATAPAASLSEREGHLAAALDVWERMSDLERSDGTAPVDGIDAAAAAAVTTPLSESRRNRSERRRRSGMMSMPQWALSSAAALVIFVGVGAVVFGMMRNEDSDTSDVALEATTEDPVTEVDALESAEAAEVAGENVGADATPVETDLSSVAAEPDGRFKEEDGVIAEATSSDNFAKDSPGSEQPAPAPEIPEIEIENSDDLAAYGSLAVPALDDSSLGRNVDFEQAPEPCDAQLGLEERLEPVVYQGVEAGVGIDTQNGVVYAYDRDSCSVIDSVVLPTNARELDDVSQISQP